MRTIENPWVRGGVAIAAGVALAGCSTDRAEQAPTPALSIETIVPAPSPSETIISVPQPGISIEASPSPSPTVSATSIAPYKPASPPNLNNGGCTYRMADGHPRYRQADAAVATKGNAALLSGDGKYRLTLKEGKVYDLAAFALKGGLAEPGDTTWVNRAEDVELENGGEAFLIDKDIDPEVGPVTAAGVMLRAVCEDGYPQGFNRSVRK